MLGVCGINWSRGGGGGGMGDHECAGWHTGHNRDVSRGSTDGGKGSWQLGEEDHDTRWQGDSLSVLTATGSLLRQDPYCDMILSETSSLLRQDPYAGLSQDIPTNNSPEVSLVAVAPLSRPLVLTQLITHLSQLLVAVFNDVTHRHVCQQLLYESLQHFQFLFCNTPIYKNRNT